MTDVQDQPTGDVNDDRRNFLKACGKYGVTVPTVMTILMSTSLSSEALAKSGRNRRKGNNGVGNGIDPPPPGNPPLNDGPGTSPGNPGNRRLGAR